ncbi:MAG: DUF2905 domain-containing protein [Acidobacteriota bacterium]
MKPLGLLLIVAGILLAAVGAAVYFGWLNWFGRLPGDVRIESERAQVHFPIVTMIVVSVVLTVVLNVLARLFGK